MPRPRIVHVIRAPSGGAFRHVRDLAEGQASRGMPVGLVCDAADAGADDEAHLASLAALPLGVKRVAMSRSVGLSDVTAAIRTCRAIGSMSPDVVHAHGAKGGLYARLYRRGKSFAGARAPAVLYAPHGGSLHYDPKSLAGRAYFAAERRLENATDFLIHVSAYEAAIYERKIGRPRCPARVVRNGVRAEEFAPIERDADAADLLYLGALRDLKGVDVFLGALLCLHADGRPVTACIVGAGAAQDVERYRAMAAPLGETVRFLDPLPARRAFALARHLVVPSRAESMPYVVLEAAAAGISMIATDVGGVPEVYGPHAWRLVPPGEAGALAGAIRTMLDAPEASAASAAQLRERVAQCFALDTMEEAIGSLYEETLAARVPRPAPAPGAEWVRS